MNSYLTIVTILFWFLTFSWSKDSWIDFMVKFGWFLMALWSSFHLFIALGYVSKGV